MNWAKRLLQGSMIIGIALSGCLAGNTKAWAGSEPDMDAPFDFEALPDDNADASPEDLLFLDIPVFIAVKGEQKLSLAPSAVSVVTAEDIRRQGARTITDVLRNVPGIEVARASNSDVNVSARGNNGVANDNMLVLIDGRSVYQDFFGTVQWDSLPVVLEDIAQIEIIRGPGGMLYGANAFAGIINIRTKDPREHEKNVVTLAGGSENRISKTFVYAGESGKWRYKTAGEISSIDNTQANTALGKQARRNLMSYSTLYYEFDPDQELRFSTGIHDSTGDTLTGFGNFERDTLAYYAQADFTRYNWDFSLWYSRLDLDVSNPLLDPYPNGGLFGVNAPQGPARILNDVIDLEVQHTTEPLEGHRITWGGGYRWNHVASANIFGDPETLNILSFFAQDEWQATDKLTVTGTLRIEDRELIGTTFAPRLSAVYAYKPEHIFRASVSRAYKNPTQVENFTDILAGITFPGPVVVPTVVTGNPNLDPQAITAFELGYNGRFRDGRLVVSVDTYFQFIEDYIQFDPISLAPVVFSFANAGNAIQYGGEVTTEYVVNDWLRAYFNWSLTWFRTRDDGLVLGTLQNGDLIPTVPRHQVNTGLFADWDNGWSGMAQLHFVDGTVNEALNPAPTGPGDLNILEMQPSYVRVDTRVARRFKAHDVEIALVTYNLFNDRHQEVAGGQILGRQVVLVVTGWF